MNPEKHCRLIGKLAACKKDAYERVPSSVYQASRSTVVLKPCEQFKVGQFTSVEKSKAAMSGVLNESQLIQHHFLFVWHVRERNAAKGSAMQEPALIRLATPHKYVRCLRIVSDDKSCQFSEVLGFPNLSKLRAGS